MAAATCIATGAASAGAMARPSDTDPQGSQGSSGAFDPLNNPFGALGALTGLQDDGLTDGLQGAQDQVLPGSQDPDLQGDSSAEPDARAIGGDTAPAAGAPQVIPATLPGYAPTTGNLSAVGAHLYRGWGFDSCSAPSLSTMRAWRHTKYHAIGVYIGGSSRNCSQPHLNREWVRAVNDMGWKILPIFVGSQSPCTTNPAKRRHVIDVDDPVGQGMDEGDEAARDAARLGLARSSPVFLDMESYRTRSTHCTAPVISFTQAWSRTMRQHGYLPGFYSSADSGITQIEKARRAGRPDLPDLMWFARWAVDPTVYGEPRLARAAWRPHRRIHQYEGEISERHGGRRLTIDRNYVDSPVAIVE